MDYKYDFDLSTKQKTLLWLYQVIPNIELIQYIYQLKEEDELEDTRIYHGMCPRTIKISQSKFIWKQHIQRDLVRLNVLFIKLITDYGFICTFKFNKSDYEPEEIEEIDNCNWVSVVPNINYNPCLKEKIKIMNLVYNSAFMLSSELYNRLEGLFYWYIHTYGTNIFRIGYDNLGTLYIPNIHIPNIHI